MSIFEELGQLEEVPQTSTDDDSGSMMIELEQNHNELSSMQWQVEEAQSTQSVLEQMDAAESPEQAVCLAREHLLNRIGYKPTVSIESFTSSSPRFKSKMAATIEFAQESVFSQLGTSIGSNITADQKLAEQIEKAVSDIKSSGNKDKPLKSPSWAGVFSMSGKKTLSAEEVISVVGKCQSIVAGSGFNSLVANVSSMLEKIANEPKRNWFAATAGSEAEVEKLLALSSKMQEDISAVVSPNLKNTSKKDLTVDCLTAPQAAKLSSEVLALLKHENLDKISKALKVEIKSGSTMYSAVSSFRYNKETPEDVRRAKKSINDFKSVLQDLNDFLLIKSRVSYSSLQYIKASSL